MLPPVNLAPRSLPKRKRPTALLSSNAISMTGRPEVLAYAVERLREAGAREAHWLPIFCKKGRPAYQLQVIVEPSDVLRMEEIILSETTTIGIRRLQMERTCLPGHRVGGDTLGDVLVKTVRSSRRHTAHDPGVRGLCCHRTR